MCCIEMGGEEVESPRRGPVRYLIQEVWAERLFTEDNIGNIVSVEGGGGRVTVKCLTQKFGFDSLLTKELHSL